MVETMLKLVVAQNGALPARVGHMCNGHEH
jgi:hypothetical protein